MDPRPPAGAIDLDVELVSRRFPGVVALTDVSLRVRGGEVVGLIGENGAGKSTLLRILSGADAPSSGHLVIDGERLAALDPAEAARRGIAIVHQELQPFPNLDVAANIMIGREAVCGRRARPWSRIDEAAMARAAQPALDRVGATFGPRTPVATLSLAETQLLEIARTLARASRLLILDEPTSSLTLSEARRLLDIIRELRQEGAAILFVSHRLAEVEVVADRVIALRDGRNAGELGPGAIAHDAMIRVMVGRDLAPPAVQKVRPPVPPVLEVEELATRAFPRARARLVLRPGEILGLAGLVGAGRTELARVLFGIDPPVAGTLRLDGAPFAPASPAEAIARGLCLVPEDRKGQGLLLDTSVAGNVALPALARLSRRGLLGRVVEPNREAAAAEAARCGLGIRPPSVRSPAAELSGGNQQKVVLAKWLGLGPRILVLDEPTRGVDVGAKAEIHRVVRALATEGVAILMISSDMEEVVGLPDRVAVMRGGEVTGVLERGAVSEEAIMRLAVADATEERA